MISFVSAVALCCIDRMRRQELIAAIQARVEDLPEDLRRGLEAQPVDRLQLLLLAARLIHVLRRLPISN